MIKFPEGLFNFNSLQEVFRVVSAFKTYWRSRVLLDNSWPLLFVFFGRKWCERKARRHFLTPTQVWMLWIACASRRISGKKGRRDFFTRLFVSLRFHREFWFWICFFGNYLRFQYLKNRTLLIQIVPVLVLNFLEEPPANARKIKLIWKAVYDNLTREIHCVVFDWVVAVCSDS